MIRLISIVLVGGLLTYLTYKSRTQSFLFEELIWGILIVIGSLIVTWTAFRDFQTFKRKNRISNFRLTFLCLAFIMIIISLEIRITNTFNKPTLLKFYYDGDFNGTAIDFKTDGTYIFDNSAIGFSSYFYGTYKIAGNRITLDKDTIANLTDLKYFEIQEKQIKERESELFAFQIDNAGNVIERSMEYRVTIDNRKSKN
ncbi:MAG: hypothetical protein EOP56_15160 [Sphingobacteriales bacterium]|nr:MAG: hypothetical protein EOP56_15160 [Sphingobacteriales bacterium]